MVTALKLTMLLFTTIEDHIRELRKETQTGLIKKPLTRPEELLLKVMDQVNQSQSAMVLTLETALRLMLWL